MNDSVVHDENWIPDDCPADVAHLVANDQVLETMGLRGLASANSKDIAAGIKKLTEHLEVATDAGYTRGNIDGYERGYDGAVKMGVRDRSRAALAGFLGGYVLGAASGIAAVYLAQWFA